MPKEKRKVRHAKGSRSRTRVREGGYILNDRIDALRLDDIRSELVRKEIFYPEHAEGAVAEYRKFLLMQGQHLRADGDGCLVFIPPDEVSEVWHAHILDLRRYLEDCDWLFGRTLFHGYAPGPGTPAYTEGARNFRRIYREMFGDPPNRFTYRCETMDKDDFAAVYEDVGGECVRIR